MKTIYSLLLSLFVVEIAQSQELDTLWSRVYGRGYYDTTGWVEETSDRGFIMTFGSRIMSDNQPDLCNTKTDSLGDTLWTKTIINHRYEIGHHITQTSDGGYLISGETTPDSASYQAHAWIIKANETGDTTWSFIYDGASSHAFYGIQTLDSGYASAGLQYVGGHLSDAFIVKFNHEGVLEWAHHYGNSDVQTCSFLAQTPDSGFVGGGYSRDTYGSEQDFWVFKTDKLGALLWDSTYAPTNSVDILYGGCSTGDGGFVFTGRSVSSGYVLRIDSLGHTIWSRTIYPVSGGFFNSIAPTSDGGFVLGGAQEIVSRGREYWIVKMSGDGDSLWSYTCGRENDDHGRCVAQTYDGNYVIFGNSSVYGQTNPYLVKFGYAEDAAEDNPTPLPAEISLMQNYPNPFNSSTVIEFALPVEQLVNLCIYDLTGRRVKMLCDNMATAGNHRLIWDGLDSNGMPMSSGLYFCKLKAGGSEQTRKVVLLR